MHDPCFGCCPDKRKGGRCLGCCLGREDAEMKIGEMVYVTVPWPGGPKSEIAKITRIDENTASFGPR
jgi:hypothetical protein